MISLKVYAGIVGCAFALAGLSGCFVSTDGSPTTIPVGTPTGTVTVTWTVSGSHSPPACSQFGAYDLELVLSDRFHRPVTTVNAPCRDFTITVPLPSGSYEGEATLVDPGGREVSTTLPIQEIRVVSGSDLTIDVDFPSTSRI